ncbi:MAG: glutathione S-transferase [Deltaproteobacteria bacterium]|jgi:glutathione S-transferase|nr:glutathione S-transferase [Deltaproteobacteria bacterium]
MSLTLLTIPISHYCERARWALDLTGLDYQEVQRLPPFHRRLSKKLGGRGSTPLLVTGDEVLSDSADIVAYAAKHGAELYPAEVDREHIDSLSAELAGRFGIEVRRIAYFHLLPDRALTVRFTGGLAPGYQKALAKVLFPPLAKRALGLYPDKVERGLGTIEDTFAAMDRRLEDGRRFFFGDQLSAADLTFAALAAPVVLAERYGYMLPTLDEVPANMYELIEHHRNRPAGQLVLRAYEQRPDSPLWPKLGVSPS